MTRSLPPSRTPLDAGEAGEVLRVLQREGVRRARIEPHVENVAHLLPLRRDRATRPSRKRSRAPSANQTSAPSSAKALAMRAISSFDLANLADGITSPVSLLTNTVIGTPQARWREMTQSGRPSIMPRMRFSPEAGTHSVSPIAFSASWRRRLVAALGDALDGLVQRDEPLRRVAEDDRLLGAPGVRILVLQAAARDERARFHQRLDDGVVGVALVALLVEDALALEARRVLGDDAVGVDGEGDGGVDAARFAAARRSPSRCR